MPVNTRKPPPPGRYPLKLVCDEIADRLGRKRGLHTATARHLGMSSQTLTKRLQQPDSVPKLDVEEIGAIAAFLEAPIGWPFVPWEIAAARLGGPGVLPPR